MFGYNKRYPRLLAIYFTLSLVNVYVMMHSFWTNEKESEYSSKRTKSSHTSVISKVGLFTLCLI